MATTGENLFPKFNSGYWIFEEENEVYFVDKQDYSVEVCFETADYSIHSSFGTLDMIAGKTIKLGVASIPSGIYMEIDSNPDVVTSYNKEITVTIVDTAHPTIYIRSTSNYVIEGFIEGAYLYIDDSSSEPTTYTVTFKDWDGTVLKTEQVEEGQSATAPSNPTRDGYTFIGWDVDFTNVTNNLTVTAQYEEIIYYTVTFKDWDETVLKTQTVEEGQPASAPDNPTRDGYIFIGWDVDFTNVTSDLLVTAQYEEIIHYIVTFKDWDGTVLKTEQVEEGQSATAPSNPTRNGYIFIGWDVDFTNVTSDLLVTAQYEEIIVKYKFNNTLYDLIPEFNAEFTGYAYEDIVDGEVTTRTIYSNSLPTMVRFGNPDSSGSGGEASKAKFRAIIELIYLDATNITTCELMFHGCCNINYITPFIITDKCTNMYGMMSGCNNLTILDVSNWDTSNVTDMEYMFYGCNNLTTLDVSNWNTSNVTNMYAMFSDCTNLTSLDVSNWNTGKVTDMESMFYGCNNLTSLDVSNWNTSNVTDMESMFKDCQSLTTLDVSNFDTSNVTDMSNMFYNCENLKHIGLLYSNKKTCEMLQLAFPNAEGLQRTIWVLDTSAEDCASNEYTLFRNYTFETQKVRIPQQLKSINNIKDKLYWDNSKQKYCIEKWIDIPEDYIGEINESLVLSTPEIIETDITEKIAFNTHNPYMKIYTNEKEVKPVNMTARFPYKDYFKSDITVNNLISERHLNEELFISASINLARGDYLEAKMSWENNVGSGPLNLITIMDETRTDQIKINFYPEKTELNFAIWNSVNDETLFLSNVTMSEAKEIKIKLNNNGITFNDDFIINSSSILKTIIKLKKYSTLLVGNDGTAANLNFVFNYIRVIQKDSDGDDIGHLGKYNHYYQTYTNYPMVVESENLCYIHDSYITEVYGNTVQNKSNLSDIQSVGQLIYDKYRIKFNVSSCPVKFGRESE